jgi:hypothetical protein
MMLSEEFAIRGSMTEISLLADSQALAALGRVALTIEPDSDLLERFA